MEANRKTASLRDLQHHMAEIMGWIDHGDEVVITRRKRIIARLVPDRPQKRLLRWPDFIARARAIVKKPSGAPLSDVLIEDREERI